MRSLSKLERMGRRRFLKTMSGLGVSAASLPHLTKDVLANSVDSLKDEIPYVARYRHTNHEEVENGARPEREPIWDTVGREHWKRTEAAHDAMRTLNSALRERFGSSNIVAGVTSGTDKYDKKLVAEYREIERGDGTVDSPSPSFTTFERSLPSSVTGEVVSNGSSFSQDIEVIPERIRQRKMCGGGYFDDEYGTSIPGGCDIDTGTAGTPAVKDDTGEQVLVSAGHVVDNKKIFSQPSGTGDDDLIYGDHTISGDHDEGYFTTPSAVSLTWALARDSGGTKSADIVGTMSWDDIKYHEGDSHVFEKQGATTGESQGNIESAYENDGVRKVSTNLEGYLGDSGGPVFDYITIPTYENDEIYLSHLNNWGSGSSSCPFPTTGGVTMEFAEESLGFTV